MADKTPVDVLVEAMEASYQQAIGRAMPIDTRMKVEAAERRRIAALEAAGYRIVDLEPTEAMVLAAAGSRIKVGDPTFKMAASIVRLALAAAPTWGGKDG